MKKTMNRAIIRNPVTPQKTDLGSFEETPLVGRGAIFPSLSDVVPSSRARMLSPIGIPSLILIEQDSTPKAVLVVVESPG